MYGLTEDEMETLNDWVYGRVPVNGFCHAPQRTGGAKHDLDEALIYGNCPHLSGKKNYHGTLQQLFTEAPSYLERKIAHGKKLGWSEEYLEELRRSKK